MHGSLPEFKGTLEAAGWTEAGGGGLADTVLYVAAAVAHETHRALVALARSLQGGGNAAHHLGLHLPKAKAWTTALGHDTRINRMAVSPQTFEGAKATVSYERNDDPLGGRDHLRIFATGQRDAKGELVWAIATFHDTGLHLALGHPESGFLFHSMQKDVGAERDQVLDSLTGRSHATVARFSRNWGRGALYGEQVEDCNGYDVTLP